MKNSGTLGKTNNPAERGAALLIAMVAAVLLTMIALTLTSSSLDEMSNSIDFEAHESALIIADSGLASVKNYLRGKDLSVELARSSSVPVYVPTTDPPLGSIRWRNPISPLDARHVDFTNPPSPSRYRLTTGFVTPVPGAPMGKGRYFAKLTDNQDEAPLGLPNNPLVDLDEKLIARVVAAAPASHSHNVSHTTSRKNAVSIVEGVLKRDLSLLIPSPLLVYGPSVLSSINGNSFTIDGYDHSGMTAAQMGSGHSDAGRTPYFGLGAAFDNPGGGDAAVTVNNLYNSLSNQQRSNVTGRAGGWGPTPSLGDATNEIRNSPLPEARNLFSGLYWKELFNRLTPIANQVYTTPTSLNNAQLGTMAAPRITIVKNNLVLSGGSTGAGLLLVRGNLEIGGNFEFDGLMVALGGTFTLTGNQKIRGGVFLSKLVENADGTVRLDPANIDVKLTGNSNMWYDRSRIRLALRLLPMLIESWREITSDIEPVN